MSDDKVRLFFYGATTTRPAAWTNVREHPHDDALEGVWRPVADDDAREERLRVAEQQADALVKDRGEMLARAEKAEAQRDAFINGREMQRARADEATRNRDEWKARAERAEARCRQIAQRIIDRIGAVGPENAEDALERLFRCDHTNAITLKRTDEARCAAVERAERAEAVISDAIAIDKGERMERPQPHHPLLAIMAGNRASLAEFAEEARKAEAACKRKNALLKEARAKVSSLYGWWTSTDLLARIDAEVK